MWRLLIVDELGERPAALREVVGAGEPLNPQVICSKKQSISAGSVSAVHREAPLLV
jgi:hypothetical protein